MSWVKEGTHQKLNPIAHLLWLLIQLGFALWFANLIEFEGESPSTPAWRLLGWIMIVLVALQWRAFIAGGFNLLKWGAILFVALALAWAFQGDRRLWELWP